MYFALSPFSRVSPQVMITNAKRDKEKSIDIDNSMVVKLLCIGIRSGCVEYAR